MNIYVSKCYNGYKKIIGSKLDFNVNLCYNSIIKSDKFDFCKLTIVAKVTERVYND